MITSFRPLCTLGVTHGYSSEGCRDFGFLVPADTAALLRNGKLLAKTREGRLHLLFEADEGGTPLRPLVGAILRFGLQLRNPTFGLVTEPMAAAPLYRNATHPATLDSPLTVKLIERLYGHVLSRTERPATVALLDAASREAMAATVTEEENRSSVSFDVRAYPPGRFRVEERYPAATVATDCYLDPEMQAAGIFGMVELTIDPAFYAAPPAFALTFAAREEILKYYLVVGKYTDAEFASLAVVDAGFGEEQRAEIVFDRVESAAFGGQELAPSLLARNGEQVVLFRSRTPVTRQERGRKNIQLRKNGDVLIKHLPQVGAADVNGDVVIHISKP